ncbi:substrate-binding domain-containing protein [Nostoc sp. 106C]|uniref:substrate-binding domain-containing protein n=1 Tax=Nostoc sp. 106C TaxID=1932667 RepID=UPI000A383F8B|nr:substrate-binding domain-containing protein [Nostoc sp. 106C]OUL31646.1 molybdenum ABC transporter substrate-binding protein [Nostoc sp. 106C]
MKTHCFAFSFIACAVSVTFPNQAFAVTLYGAGSLRGALSDIAIAFEADTNIHIDTKFGPSGQLKDNIINDGERPDVFASADIGNALKVNQAGLSSPVVNFISNRMTAIVRTGLSVTSNNILDILLDPNIRVGTSTPLSDPSGDYAWQIFDKADQVKVGSSQILKNKALQLVGGNPNAPVVPNGQNNLVYFLKGIPQDTPPLADIFLAYYTSSVAAQEIANDLQIVELPDYLAVKADYGLTVLNNASSEGKQLAEYILSKKAQDILVNKYKFSSPSTSTSVPEANTIGGTFLALAIAIALKKKQAFVKKQE